MRLTVFSDDWGRHPSSCQHLVHRLLDRYPVTWVNTIGTRRPAIDYYSLKRSVEKLAGWLRGRVSSASKEPANPTVLTPLMWPSFGSILSRRLNASLLTHSLSRHLRGTDDHVAVTTLPITADLVGRLPVSRWVYYCVDDLSEWPGLDKRTLEIMERELVQKVDTVIAVSDTLVTRLRGLGRDPHLLTHGVDTELWAQQRCDSTRLLSGLTPPYIVFWGVVDQRLDIECLRALSTALAAGSIVLAGPHNNPDPALKELSNVHLVGQAGYEELPTLARAASVLIMPYRDAPVTRAMQPLKLMEYLSTGKPVVCRNLPAVRKWSDACDVYETPPEFVSLVLGNLNAKIPSSQAEIRQSLRHEGWADKAAQFEAVLFE